STPSKLRKGPRGDGRDRDKMLDHVFGAEAAYGRQIGVKHPQAELGATRAVKALRKDIAEALRGASDGSPVREKGWPPRYALRRLTWHVLDHVWEMQDRTEACPGVSRRPGRCARPAARRRRPAAAA